MHATAIAPCADDAGAGHEKSLRSISRLWPEYATSCASPPADSVVPSGSVIVRGSSPDTSRAYAVSARSIAVPRQPCTTTNTENFFGAPLATHAFAAAIVRV